jgi:hypothetical protein
MVLEEGVIHMIRTAKVPFFQSRPSAALCLSTFAIAVLPLAAGFSGLAVGLDMAPLPPRCRSASPPGSPSSSPDISQPPNWSNASTSAASARGCEDVFLGGVLRTTPPGVTAASARGCEVGFWMHIHDSTAKKPTWAASAAHNSNSCFLLPLCGHKLLRNGLDILNIVSLLW